MKPTQWYSYVNRISGSRGRFDLACVIEYSEVFCEDDDDDGIGTEAILAGSGGITIEFTTPYDDFCAIMDKYNAPPSNALRPQANPLPKGDA
jgi:hypothetical protein